MNNKTKQQEIENMMRFIPTSFTKDQRRLIAEKLVDANYSRLPDGVLWLTSGNFVAQPTIFLGQAPSYLELEADLKDKVRRQEYANAKKTVAKEVLQDVYDKCFELVDPYNDDCEECKGSVKPDDILSLAEYYGVEIEQ